MTLAEGASCPSANERRPVATEYIKIEEIKPQPRVIQRGIVAPGTHVSHRSDLTIGFKRERIVGWAE